MKNRHKKIGTWVSIGTARAMSAPDVRINLVKLIKKTFEMVGEPEQAHVDMETESRRDGFLYHRFNQPNGLTIEMYEWSPRGSGENSGVHTLEAMDTAFARWFTPRRIA